MACQAVHTGDGFLASALLHIDCQAQSIGSYGWGALAEAGSPVSLALASLLTIFIAALGLRIMLGYPFAAHDVVTGILKVGVVLTLATSWPAWRILGYDLFVHGPDQLAQVIGIGAGLPGSDGDLAERLQNLDSGLSALNAAGSGRLGVAQGDWFQLGFARSAFLVATLGPSALVRLVTGFLLAIAPLMAGLLLFGITRGLFEGWLRALVATFLSSMLLTTFLGVELALITPWIQDVLDQRASQTQTLDAPVEILVMCLAFALVNLGGLPLVTRLAFHGANAFAQAIGSPHALGPASASSASFTAGFAPPSEGAHEPSRAQMAAEAISRSDRRETRLAQILSSDSRGAGQGQSYISGASRSAEQGGYQVPLGNAWRRPGARSSGAARRRDTGK